MEFFKKTPQIDFLRVRYSITIISVTLFLLTILSVSLHGLHWGLDFTGGVQLQLELKKPISLVAIRKKLAQTQFSHLQLQSYGGSSKILLTLPGTLNTHEKILTQTISDALPESFVQKTTFVGPQAGKTLLINALWALGLALLGILTYVTMRFEYRLAIGAIIALIHDPIIILGAFSWFQVEINLTTLAAILTVIGYSLNNIVIIFDRIRENCNCLTNQSLLVIVNQSINETLTRTFITSGITFMMVTILYLFGGVLLNSFALALAIGILVGAYSSIYVASSLAIALGLSREHMIFTPTIDDRP